MSRIDRALRTWEKKAAPESPERFELGKYANESAVAVPVAPVPVPPQAPAPAAAINGHVRPFVPHVTPDLEARLVTGGSGAVSLEQYRRLAARRGAKRALIAVAHTILIIAYHIIRDGTTYDDLGSNYFDERDRHSFPERRVKIDVELRELREYRGARQPAGNADAGLDKPLRLRRLAPADPDEFRAA